MTTSTAPAADIPVTAGPIAASEGPAVDISPVGTDELVQQDLLVEDVSIDGMCGVY